MFIKTYTIPTDGFATEPIEKCPVCASTKRHFAFRKYGDPYYTCEACASFYLGMRPTPKKMQACYAEVGKYAQIGKMRQFTADSIPLSWQKYFDTAKELKQSSGMKHLDVGCGAGECLLVATHFGWKSTGIDMGETAIQFIKDKLGLEALNNTIEGANFPDNSFDLITMNVMLEHVINPVDVCREISRILRPGGVLVVVVPVTKFLGYSLFGNSWHSIHSAHLQHFSERGLSLLMKKFDIHPKHSYTVGGGALGHRIIMNIFRTDTAWTVFSYMTGCKDDGWAGKEPIGWFTEPARKLDDERLLMRHRADEWVKKHRFAWNLIGYPIHWLSKRTDRQQSITMFGVKQ